MDLKITAAGRASLKKAFDSDPDTDSDPETTVSKRQAEEFKTFAQIVNIFAPFAMALNNMRLQNILKHFSGKQVQATVK